MPLSLAKPPCDCLARTAEALDRFPNFSTKSPPDIHYIPMDGVLIMGAGLVEHWELLNGCETDTHLDAKMMQTMIDAVTKTLTLYEAALELILGSWSQTQEPNGGGIDRSDNLSSTHERSSNSSVDTKPTVIVTEVTVYLGRLELGREESAIVARGALHHATMRLGEMLHDIEEDMSTILVPANTQGNVGVGKVGQLMSRLLRILGRISSSYRNLWT